MGSIRTNNKEIDVVNKFCYLGDMICAEWGAGESIVTRIRCGWKKFKELLPLSITKGFSLRSKGPFYQACIQSVVIYGGETWAVREEGFTKLERNDVTMIRWMWNVSLKDRVPSDEFHEHVLVFPSENVNKSIDYGGSGLLLRCMDAWWLLG